MTNMLKKAGLGIALAATALTAAAPAEAQRYRGHYRGHDNGGTAVVAGIAGLAIGAVIASSANRNRDRYYDDRGYDGYAGYDGYYDGRDYNQRNYYQNDGYYNGYNGGYDGGRRGYQRCYSERRFDPYYQRSVRVQVCR